MLAALVVGAVVGAALNWFFFTRNGAAPGIALVGKVAAGLAPISTSDFSVESLKKLAPVSLAVALFSLTASVSVARALATRTGQMIQSKQEFIGQ